MLLVAVSADFLVVAQRRLEVVTVQMTVRRGMAKANLAVALDRFTADCTHNYTEADRQRDTEKGIQMQ